MPNKFEMTIGADPEFFVMEKKGGEVVPACRKFGGEKRAPVFLSPSGGYLEDGTTVEFNVTPSNSLADTTNNIQKLILIFLNKHDQYKISRYSSATFTDHELKQYPEALQIGCSPDLFAYGIRLTPTISAFKNKRFAGGHIHVGIQPWPEGLQKDTFIKFLDLLFLCPASRVLADKDRWRFYGHPGLYRETAYGVEYRSPDNFWCNPARWAANPETRDYLNNLINQFDAALGSLNSCLNFDGHGARVNDQLNTFIGGSEIEVYMNQMETLKDPQKLMNVRNYNCDCTYQARRWASSRRRMSDLALSINEPVKKSAAKE